MKIQIIGFSGSGKSTFAKRLGTLYNIPVLHIDSRHFSANWVERDDSIVQNEIRDFMKQENWIIDGQYVRLANERFDLCDRMFLFEFNRLVCLFGILRRYFRHHGKERDCCGEGCIEGLDWSFVKWVLRDGRTKKILDRNKNFKEKYKDKIIVFKNRHQVNKYLRSIGYQGTLKY